MTVFINPNNPVADATVKELEAAAHAMGLQTQALRTSSGREIDAAFEMFARERPDALFIAGDTLFNSRRVQLALLAALHRLPMTCGLRSYVEAGGLMSYGADLRMPIAKSAHIPAASSRAPSLRTCRSCSRPNSSWSSTIKQPGFSA